MAITKPYIVFAAKCIDNEYMMLNENSPDKEPDESLEDVLNEWEREEGYKLHSITATGDTLCVIMVPKNT